MLSQEKRREKKKAATRNHHHMKRTWDMPSVVEKGTHKTATGEGWEEGLTLILPQGR